MAVSFVLFFTVKRSLESMFLQTITDEWSAEGFSFAQLTMVKLLQPKSTAVVVAYDEVVPLRCNIFTPYSFPYFASFASLFKIETHLLCCKWDIFGCIENVLRYFALEFLQNEYNLLFTLCILTLVMSNFTHRTSESLPSNFQCLMTLTNCLFSPQKSRFLSVNMALYSTL